jgi:hypothetical protein
VRGRIEDGRLAVGLDVADGEVLTGEPVDLGQHVPGGLHVDLFVRGLAERLGAEHLEQVEPKVTNVALVVAHARGPAPSPCYR